MTPTKFIARFPEFKSVPTAVLNDLLCEAADLVGDCWEEPLRSRLIGYLTAHFLTSQGHNPTAAGVVKRRKVGDVETEYVTASGSTIGDYGTTPYGLRYLDLLKRSGSGVGVFVV